MDVRAKKTEGLVLRARDYSDNHRILIVLTRDFGKLPMMARGAKKPTSSLMAASQLFTQSEMLFAQGKSMATLTQAQVVNAFGGLRQDLVKIAYASYIAEMIDYALPDGKSVEAVYILAITTLLLLEATDDCALIARYFEVQLMSILGYRPYLERCPVCNRPLHGGTFYLVPERGSIVCSNCLLGQTGQPLSLGGIKTLSILLSGDLRSILKLHIVPAIGRELAAGMASYCDYYIEKSERARAALADYLT